MHDNNTIDMNIEFDGITAELLEILGADGFLTLVENYGGLRIYIPQAANGSKLNEFLNDDQLQKLCNHYKGTLVTVPLARQFRARTYRQNGLNNRQIARKIGLTEKAVVLLFKKQPMSRPAKKPKIDPRQIDLFQN